MNLTLIEKSIIPLFLATLLIGGFYWQFPIIYALIIESFTEDKLSILYSHLLIYTFLVLILFIFLSNSLNYFFIKSKVFVAVVIVALLTFYSLSSSIIYDVFEYFIFLKLPEDAIMGLTLFIVTTLGYAFYSLFLLVFNKFVPLSHSIILMLITLIYSLFFIDTYCYPISEIVHKF